MKHAKEDARRWLKQAKHDYESAKNNLEKVKFYSDACFMSEQAAQKTLKAYLLYRGERYVLVHSVQSLVSLCSNYDEDFRRFIDYGKKLDRYYIPTRYPDALSPPAVPYESYTEEDAREAVGFAEEIIKLVDSKIKVG